MNCHQHSDIAAAASCAGCAEPFCNRCLVCIKGQSYCASCKAMAVPASAAIQVPCKEASEALKYALIGMVVFGLILEPVAFAKALAARKLMRSDPTLSGSGKATAALVLSSVTFGLWALAIFSSVAKP